MGALCAAFPFYRGVPGPTHRAPFLLERIYMGNDLITIDSYCDLSKTSLKFKKEVTQDEWLKVFNGLKSIEGCVQFWIGDALAYRERRWGMYEDVSGQTGYEPETLRKFKDTAEAVKSGTRVPDLGYRHHQEVVSLPPDQQAAILKKASEEHLTVKETREEVKAIKRGEDKEAPPLPDGKYSVIYADPPWPVESMVLEKWESPLDDKYPTMTIDEICSLDIASLSASNCALFIWTTHTFLKETFQVIESWGFKYHACITWDKKGGWTLCGIHRRTEFCLYAYKGKMNIEQKGNAIETIFQEAKGKHSQKPIWMRSEIERKIKGKKIELFARKKIEGWDVWGNQV